MNKVRLKRALLVAAVVVFGVSGSIDWSQSSGLSLSVESAQARLWYRGPSRRRPARYKGSDSLLIQPTVTLGREDERGAGRAWHGRTFAV